MSLAQAGGFADDVARAGWFVVALVAVLVLALAGRRLAGALRQPPVVGEVALGLATGPLVLSVTGSGAAAELPLDWLPLGWLRACGHAGLVLFLVGVIHELRAASLPVRGRVIGWGTAGAIAVPMLAGAVLAGWTLTGGGPGLRGDAPAVALVVFLAASLSVTAVPVLARILSDQHLAGTRIGVLAMTVAMVTDVAAWLLVAVAVSLAARGSGGGSTGVPALGALAALAAAGALALPMTLAIRRLHGTTMLARLPERRLPGTAMLAGLPARRPMLMAVFVAAWALGAAALLWSWGLTEILGAALVALAIPLAWTEPVRMVARVGRLLVPVFFVVTGFSVFAEPFAAPPWTVIVLVTLLGVAGKVGGTYVGARIGGEPHEGALSLGVLLNTRGLTELVVLQIGYDAGILTPAMFLALAVMALLTTAATGPLYALVHRDTGPAALPAPIPQNGGSQ
jgi:Kef-type K+ transport system membrane component KefB